MIILISVMLLLLTACTAFADTLQLPSGLKTIDDEAFMNDTALDSVIVPEGVISIGERAFFGTSISQLALPSSLKEIGSDAFYGCADMTVTAPSGSWAYEWALKNGYLKRPKNSTTQIIMPATIHAGEDLSVSIIGASNTVRHGIYLINDQDNTRKYRSISKASGMVTWEGYDLETGTYHITVYTVTDSFVTLQPVSQQLEVIGSKPIASELDFPYSVPFQSGVSLTFDSIESMMVNVTLRDSEGNEVGTYSGDYWDQQIYLDTYNDALAKGGSLDLQYIIKQNGLWCQPLYTIIAVTQHGRPGIPDITFPQEITAGKDLVITYSYVPNVTSYWFYLFTSDNNEESIYSYYVNNSGSGSIVIPGYYLDGGQYTVRVRSCNDNADDEYSRYASDDFSFTVSGEKFGNIPEVISDSFVTYQDENICFTVSCPNANRIAVKYHYQDTTKNEYDKIKSYFLDDEGKIYIEEIVNVDFKYLSVCAEYEGVYSNWSEPNIWTIIQKESLSTPSINIPDIISAGENIKVSWNNVPNAEYYYLSIEEAYSSQLELYSDMIEAEQDLSVIIPGYLFNQGYYIVRLRASADKYLESYSDSLFRVSGTRINAPTVTPMQDTLCINKKATFSIDTEGGNELRIECIDNSTDGGYYNLSYNPLISESQTEWVFTPYEYMKNISVTLKFAIYRNGTWSAWKTLSYTIEDLEQLAQPIIHIDDTYQAGKTIVLRFDAVENANYFDWRITDTSSNQRINSGRKEINSTTSIYGYEIEPGTYRYKVTAYADDYRSNSAETVFTVVGSKQPMSSVTVDKTNISAEEKYTFTIDTANMSALRYRIIEYNSTYSINVLSDTTRFTNNASPEEQLTYQFAGFTNGMWTAWSKPITITKEKMPVLESPIIHVEESFLSGHDVQVSFENVDGANYYYIYLLDEQEKTIQSVYRSSVSPVTFSGYYVSPGYYTVRVRASGTGQSSSTDQIIQVLEAEKAPSPEIINSETNVSAGSYVSFIIDTTNSTQLAVRYYQDGYTNNLQYNSVNASDISTVWRQHRSNPGETWYYQFAVYHNEAWSEWTPWQEVHVIEAE